MKQIIILIIVLIMANFALAQVEIQTSAFYVDFATFASDSADLELLEVYYQIYTSKLSFIRKDGKFFADYNVSIVIFKGKKQYDAIESEGSLYVDTYDEAQNKDSYIINSTAFYLKPGKYKLKLTLNDLNASSSLPLETDIKVPNYKNNVPVFSKIEFVREITSVDKPSNFDKDQWKVIPSCSRRYGDGLTQLKFYYEFYDKNKTDDSIRIDYRIMDYKNDVVIADTVFKQIQTKNVYIDSISLDNLKPGPHELVISARVGPKNKEIKSSGKFKLIWSALELVKNDFETAVDQLIYIAKPKDMNALRKISQDRRIKEWNEFWKSIDPTPGTDENELKNEYYRRLTYTDKHFKIPIKEGWRTDMGMIHIINGEPDDIERHPFDIDTKPYEIWYYYNPRRRFLFIDTRGYGEYELQYPYDGDVTQRINIYEGGP